MDKGGPSVSEHVRNNRLRLVYLKLTYAYADWAMVIGFGLVMGSLILETYRVFRIFLKSKAGKTVVFTDSKLLLGIGIIVLGEIFLFLVGRFNRASCDRLSIKRSQYRRSINLPS